MRTSMDRVLDTTATELADLERRASALQDGLSALLCAQGQLIPEAQDLDYLVQHLGGLADFLLGLRAMRACSCSVDARSASLPLRLSRLAERMFPTVCPPQAEAACAAGELDLF